MILSRVYIWMQMGKTHLEARRGRINGTFIHCSAFAEASNRPYINILNVNSLWSTDSRLIEFCCLPNVCCTVECYLPRLGNTFALEQSYTNATYYMQHRICDMWHATSDTIVHTPQLHHNCLYINKIRFLLFIVGYCLSFFYGLFPLIKINNKKFITN